MFEYLYKYNVHEENDTEWCLQSMTAWILHCIWNDTLTRMPECFLLTADLGRVPRHMELWLAVTDSLSSSFIFSELCFSCCSFHTPAFPPPSLLTDHTAVFRAWKISLLLVVLSSLSYTDISPNIQPHQIYIFWKTLKDKPYDRLPNHRQLTLKMYAYVKY